MAWIDDLFESEPNCSLYKFYKLLKIRKNASNYKIKKSLHRITILERSFEFWKYYDAAKELLSSSNADRRKNYKNPQDFYEKALGHINPYMFADTGHRIDMKFMNDPAKFVENILNGYEKYQLSGKIDSPS